MIGRLLRLLRGQGLRKGVVGGNRRWLTIWAVVFTAQTAHKFLKPKPVVERFELKPGETIVITDFGDPAFTS
ncbi:MAG: hypothetical protein QOC92_2044 [Acidimicrobiaceae bacterium]